MELFNSVDPWYMENTGGSTEVLWFSSSTVDKIYKKSVFEKQAWTEFALKH
jgi:hypothetical protein